MAGITPRRYTAISKPRVSERQLPQENQRTGNDKSHRQQRFDGRGIVVAQRDHCLSLFHDRMGILTVKMLQVLIHGRMIFVNEMRDGKENFAQNGKKFRRILGRVGIDVTGASRVQFRA